MDQIESQRQGGLQPDDPHGGLVEFHFLFQGAVRGVIGSDDINGSVL